MNVSVKLVICTVYIRTSITDLNATFAGPGDYDSITNQPITFRPGTLTQTIIAETNNDDNLENVEQFLASLLVNIDLYPGVTIGTGPATVNIIDSDSEIHAFTQLSKLVFLC